MKEFEEAKIEVVTFDDSVIVTSATPSCDSDCGA